MSYFFYPNNTFLHHIINNNINHSTMGNLTKKWSGGRRGRKFGRNWADSPLWHTKLAKKHLYEGSNPYLFKWASISIPNALINNLK